MPFSLLSSIQNEKAQLYTHRSSMLRLNASVHSWLTQQERKKADLVGKQQQIETVAHALANNSITKTGENGDITLTNDSATQSIETATFIVDDEFHKQLKNEVGNMYSVWEEADRRFVYHIS